MSMGPARTDYRSRGTAAIVAVVFHIAFLFLLTVPLRRVAPPTTSDVEPMLVKLIDRPHGQHQDSDRRALAPRLTKPTPRMADTPPNVDIVIPVDIRPPPQPSAMLAALPPGTKDVSGEGSPAGRTQGSGEGAGPALLHHVAPVYSSASLRAHEQGTVILRVLVNSKGVPSEVRLARSSGFPRLDQSALESVKRYRYAPPSQDARPELSWATAYVRFDLLRMPVPTAVVRYDSLVAAQVAIARRTRAELHAEARGTDEVLRRLAERLIDTLGRDSIGRSDPRHSDVSATPPQMLARQGKLKSMRFLGFAGVGFDCGSASVAVDAKTLRCEVFEAQQANGLSYWLALVENSRSRLQSLLISAGTQPLSADSPARQ
jgi:protein TonB